MEKDSKARNYFLLAIKLIITGLCLYFLFTQVSIEEVIKSASLFPAWAYLLFISLYFVFLLISSWQLSVLLSPLDCIISFNKVIKYFLISWAFGMLGPGKTGDFTLPFFLKKEGVSYAQGFFVSILIKLWTLFALAVLTVGGLMIFFDLSSGQLIKYAGLPLIGCAFGGVMGIVFRQRLVFILGRWQWSTELFECAKNYCTNYNVLALSGASAFLRWTTDALMTLVLLYSAGFTVSIFYIMAINSISNFAAFIPVSISGLGIREITKVKLFSMVLVPTEIAAAVAIIYTVWGYMVAVGILILYKQE